MTRHSRGKNEERKLRISSQNSNRISLELARTSRAINRSLDRLSSGKALSSSADLSYATRLTSQLRGLTQGVRNINDSLSMTEMAESVLGSQLELLQRMREIGVQAGNGTLTTSERENLNDELQSLLAEFQRLTDSTEYNGFKLIDGTFGTKAINLNGDRESVFDLSFDSAQASTTFTKIVGTGAFSAPITLEGGGESGIFVSADFNNDGNLDYASADGAEWTFKIHLGHGDGTFTQVQTLTNTYDDAASINVGDFNNDGILDLVTSESAASISIHLGQGDGTFQSMPKITGVSPVFGRYVIEDFNNDDNQDLSFADGSGNIVMMLGNGDGTLQNPTTFYSGGLLPTSPQAGDINGDGILDIYYGVFSTTAPRFALGNGDGTFQTPQTIGPNLGSPLDVRLLDIDNDGDLDSLALSSSVSQVSIYLNDGSGNFSVGTTITGLGTFSSINHADFNRDGNIDLFIGLSSSTRAYLYFGNGDGTFQERLTVNLQGNGNSWGATFGDFNNDNVVDFISSGDSPALFISRTTNQNALTDVNVLTQDNTATLLEVVDNAIQKITEQRSSVASLHNRLEIASSANLLMSENIEEALSKAQDTDIATETAELVRNQILKQAQIAVLAQANIQMQTVLGLLNTLPIY